MQTKKEPFLHQDYNFLNRYNLSVCPHNIFSRKKHYLEAHSQEKKNTQIQLSMYVTFYFI